MVQLKLQFKPTTTPHSERILANTLGYPKSWHVVRFVPHPLLPTSNTFQDIIYTGDPEVADAYFNHTAAMDAAMTWMDGENNNNTPSPFDDEGGQLLPLERELMEFEEGDEVQVYYEQDCEWYHATIIEVIPYRDDVRYTVQFTLDEATQTNVCLERMRVIKSTKKPKGKGKKGTPAKNSSTSKGNSTSTGTASRKRKSTVMTSTTIDDDDTDVTNSADSDGNSKNTNPAKKAKTKNTTPKKGQTKAKAKPTTPKSKGKTKAKALPKSMTKSATKNKRSSYGSIGYIPDTTELNLASKFGLPEGWAASVKPNSRFLFKSPDGEMRFKSKKAVFEHLGLPMPKHGHNPLVDDDDMDIDMDGDDNDDESSSDTEGKETKVAESKTQNDEEGNDPIAAEDDPPWRTSDHKFIGRRVQYTFLDGIHGKGTITGWISDKDVDSAGDPGFVSEKTNKPACLFHVTMDLDCPVASQDFEEYEVDEILIGSAEDSE
jgi:hypothetical protein